MPLEAFYFAAGTLAVLTFLVFLTFNIWKTYRQLDWRQAALFSAALFFAAGVVSQFQQGNAYIGKPVSCSCMFNSINSVEGTPCPLLTEKPKPKLRR